LNQVAKRKGANHDRPLDLPARRWATELLQETQPSSNSTAEGGALECVVLAAMIVLDVVDTAKIAKGGDAGN
jgi:hypothetical protein